jgi:hypothetical protein
MAGLFLVAVGTYFCPAELCARKSFSASTQPTDATISYSKTRKYLKHGQKRSNYAERVSAIN